MSKLFDYALSQVSDEVKYFVDNSVEITNQIHSILERQGKTQRDLANLLGKSESEVSKWLTGTHNFTLKSISKIEVVLNEKLITTPLLMHQSFLKMAENAIPIQFLNFQSSIFFPIVRWQVNNAILFEMTCLKEKETGELRIERDLYAMVA